MTMTSYEEYREERQSKMIEMGIRTEVEAFTMWYEQYFKEELNEAIKEEEELAEKMAYVNNAVDKLGMEVFTECMSVYGNKENNLKNALELGKVNDVLKSEIDYRIMSL